MAVYKILRAGDQVLRQIAEPVPENEITAKETKKLVRDMFDTMIDAKGLGLAAPQIGILKQIVVIGFSKNERYPKLESEMERQVLINPVITPVRSEILGFWEGCLSVHGMRGYVERPSKIKLAWNDEKGEAFEKIIDGFNAVVYQHECDHLQGILYLDRLKDPRLFGFNEELEIADSINKTQTEAV